MARRRQEEFYCSKAGGGCESYFLTWLRDDMWGNFTVECPGCKHHHFRVIKEGQVTEDRHNEKLGSATILMSMPSTLRKKPWTDDKEFRKQQLQIYQGGKQNASRF